MTDEGLYGALPMGFENLGPEGKQSVKKVVVKLHLKKDETYKTFAITNTTTTAELLSMYAKKLGLSAALGESLQLIHVDGKGGERPIDSRDRPGGMQLIWQQQNLANQKLVVTFSEASKESIRQSVNKRRSSTADALDRHLGLAAAAAAAPAAGGGANSAAINSIDDDLAALDAIAADFATPVLPNVSAAAAAAKKPAVLVPATSAASKSRAAKPRLKIVPIGEDAEYQGLLAALKANRPAAAAAPASLDDFDSIMVGIDGGDSGGAHGGASRSADLVALEEFGLTDDDFNALPAANDNSDTGKKKAAAPHSDAFAEIDGALSFALSGLDDIAIAESAAGDGIDIDFDAMLAQLSKDSDQLTHEMSKH